MCSISSLRSCKSSPTSAAASGNISISSSGSVLEVEMTAQPEHLPYIKIRTCGLLSATYLHIENTTRQLSQGGFSDGLLGSRRVSRDHDWHTTARPHDAMLAAAVAARHLLAGPALRSRGARSHYLYPTLYHGTLLFLCSATAPAKRRPKSSSGGARPRRLTPRRGPTHESRLSASLDTPKWRHFPAAPAVP
jgi:hypothetical protein